MAFGFFKKAESADLILTNGSVYTADANALWAEAVAVKDGKIIAVGDADSIETLAAAETEIIDLENGFLLPGFIETRGTPVLRAFDGEYLMISEDYDMTEIQDALHDFIEDEPQREVYFAVGFNETVNNKMNLEEKKDALDAVCREKPVVLLSASGLAVWMNSCAAEMLAEAAEQDQVKNMTISYIMSVFACLDFEAIERNIMEIAGMYCEKGVTSVMNVGSIDYFDGIYQDILLSYASQGMLKQRLFGSLFVNRAASPHLVVQKLRQRKTNCNEIEWGIEFRALYLDISEKSGFFKPEENRVKEGENSGLLTALVKETADAGFDIHIETQSMQDAFKAVRALEAAISAGYKKNVFAVACEEGFSQEDFADTMLGENITKAPIASRKDGAFMLSALDTAKTIAEAIDALTIDAAVLLGKEDEIGSITVGKAADFAVFEENPFELTNFAAFRRCTAVMTIVNGQVVYDKEEDNRSEWYELMTGMYL